MTEQTEKKPTAINVQYLLHANVIPSVVEFFEVTTKRAFAMLRSELTRNGMTRDSVLVCGQDNNLSVYELCTTMQRVRELAGDYPTHRVVHLTTGEVFVVRPPKGTSKKSTLEKLLPDLDDLSEPITNDGGEEKPHE
jgi:hypothetical protein